MKSLKEYTSNLKDLQRQHDINSRRYYNRDSEAIILKLINDELSENSQPHSIPGKLYFALAQIDQNNSVGIETLCGIYREIILLNSKQKMSLIKLVHK